ncbi:MAG: dTMP kinase [Bacilli bacterium]|nr:dTMP kinase [Bacilli bacterium]
MGLFVTFEGGEGSGKTTLINRLHDEMVALNFPAIKTREPGGNKISEQIRNIILDVENNEMDYRTEALLYAASRRQHLTEVILPALKQGKTVLCDRFLDSSLAYQGYARGLGIDNVYRINLYATEGIMPDITIYIDVSPQEGLNRISNSHREVDRLDLENSTFHAKVHEGYLKLAEMFPERIKVIDGARSLDEINLNIKTIVLAQLRKG